MAPKNRVAKKTPSRRPKTPPARDRSASRSKAASALRDRSTSHATASFSVPLTDSQVAWIDSIALQISSSGGPLFTREQVLESLISAASGRPIDVRKVKTAEDLRVAFGALDLSAVEKMLRDRPRIEGGLLKALEDSIK